MERGVLHVAADELFETKVALVGQVGVQAPVRYPPAASMNMTNSYRGRVLCSQSELSIILRHSRAV